MTNSQLTTYLPELLLIWDALVRRDTLPEQADVVLVGGCSDIGLAERAAEIYHAGIALKIVISGYQSKFVQTTEARLLADHCIKLGVPSEDIIREETASNTGENIRFSAEIIGRVQSVILVHKPYMSLRFLATAEAQWPMPQPTFYTTCQDISFKEYSKLFGLGITVHRVLGDMKRMNSYVEHGYQTQQHIPEEAWAAYDKLVSLGLETR
jgi:uncharacterized SAM-binding protein YcdF (DUF218 family)